jgi:glutathione synthase
MQVLWITDPWETLDHPRDTTVRLMRECLDMGVDTWWSNVRSLRSTEHEVRLDARRLAAIPASQLRRSIQLAEPVATAPRQFSSIHFRVDPPVDESYAHALRLLVADAGRGTVINDPRVLFSMTSKLAPLTLNLPSPPSLVSAQWEELQAFLREQRDTLLKPLADMQGRGVTRLRWRAGSETAIRRTLEAATGSFRKAVLLQTRIGVGRSEARLWFIDGRLIAGVSKSRSRVLGEVRLSAAQARSVRRIAPALRQARIRFAAVDILDDRVIDLNFASPGLLVESERAIGKNLARTIMKTLLRPRRAKAQGGDR